MILLLSSLLACGPKQAPAGPEAAQPTPQELFAAYGERVAVPDDVVNLHVLMDLEMPAQGITGRIEAWQTPPNLTLMHTEMDGLGLFMQGYDGETAWVVDPINGPHLQEGDERAEAIFGADFYGYQNWEQRYIELENKGQEDFEGSAAWHVQGRTAHNQEPIHFWFSVEDGVLVGQQVRVSTGMGKIKSTTLYEDYDTMAGAWGPTVLRVRVLGMDQVMTVREVETNVEELPDFAPPAEIQALLAE